MKKDQEILSALKPGNCSRSFKIFLQELFICHTSRFAKISSLDISYDSFSQAPTSERIKGLEELSFIWSDQFRKHFAIYYATDQN